MRVLKFSSLAEPQISQAPAWFIEHTGYYPLKEQITIARE